MQKIDLSILPQGTINPIVRCSQGDVGRQFQVELYNEDMSAKYVLDGTETLTVEGHKPDGNFFSYDLPSTTGSVITVTTQEQMTACYGEVYGEIRIAKGDTLLGTANFTLSVEIGASAQDTVSISALQFIDALRTEMNEAVADTEDARDDAIDAKTDAENARDASQGYANDSSDYADASKAWAVGPSGSGSGSDTNNAKYYSGLANTSATNAESAKNDAVSAKDTAVSAKNDAISAKNDAVQAKTDAISAKNDAVQAKTDAQTAKADAVQAKNDAVSAKTAAQSAQTGAESAQQKIENMTASASGLPAGSNPTVSKTEVGGVVNLGFGIPKGDKGDKGDTGDDGISPSASVTQTDPDTITFTVTDRQGTTTATLSAGGAPSLAGCSDVNIQSPADKQGLVYDANTSKWVNGQAGCPPYNGQANGWYIEAGSLTFYNDNTEYYDNALDPTQWVDTSNSELSWYMGIPICLKVEKESEKVSGQWIANYCPLVASRIYWTGYGITFESSGDPGKCLYYIKKTAEDQEQGLAYNIDFYFLLPDNTGRLVKVTYAYDDYGAMTSNTMTYISLGGGGGSATPGYVILGEINSSDNYTPANYSTIMASAGNLNNLVVKQSFENGGYAILQPIGVQIDNVVAGTQIFEPASKVFTDLIGGAYPNSVLVFTILFNKIGAAPQVLQYYVQFVVDGSSLTLQANSLSVLTVGPSL